MPVPWVLDQGQLITPLHFLLSTASFNNNKVIGQSREPTRTGRNDDSDVARQKSSQKGLKVAQVWTWASFRSSNWTKRKNKDLRRGEEWHLLEPTLGLQLTGWPEPDRSHLPSLQIVLLEEGHLVVSSNFETRLVLGSNSDSNTH